MPNTNGYILGDFMYKKLKNRQKFELVVMEVRIVVMLGVSVWF